MTDVLRIAKAILLITTVSVLFPSATLATACSDANLNAKWLYSNIDWQNPGSPFEFMKSYAIAWECTGDVPCYPTLRTGKVSNALDALILGHKGDAGAQQSYRDCYRELGPEKFGDLITAATTRTCDLKEAEVNIRWQHDNNFASLRDSISYWNDRKEPFKRYDLMALYYVLSGQRHNDNTMNLYRACFRDKKTELFQIVDRYAH